MQTAPVTPQHKAFVEEINEKGVYIHKIDGRLLPIEGQLEKIERPSIPTAGTFVGPSVHSAYKSHQWTDTSGIVLGPDTVSLLSYKADISSYRLKTCTNRNFLDFSHGSLHERQVAYSRYLSKKFNRLGLTPTGLRDGQSKQLRLVEDISFAKSKYREIELRSNLAFRRTSDAVPGAFRDQASKHLIVDILQSSGRPLSSWKKSDLLAELKSKSMSDEALAPLIEHAIIKIAKFKDDAALQTYLQRGTKPPNKVGHYTKIIKSLGVQMPNEHLLLPGLKDVVGICVNIDSVAGIDHALEINASLREKQKAAGIANRDNPALINQISPKKNSSMVHVGWSQDVIPWSSKALISFAKSKGIEGIDGNQFEPDHFLLIRKMAEASSLVFFDEGRVINNCWMSKNFVDDLSQVKEGRSNLLHLAIKHNAGLDTIKFFYFWKVDAFSEKNADGKTALDLAIETNHPGTQFLRDAGLFNDSEAEVTAARNKYIAGQLAEITKGSSTYRLRDGSAETGKISFIPELGTYRVTRGEFTHDSEPGVRYEGVRKYCDEHRDMSLSIGCRMKGDSDIRTGFWELTMPVASSKVELGLGYQHLSETEHGQNGIATTTEYVNFRSLLDDHTAAFAITILARTERFALATLEGGFSLTDSGSEIDSACCSHFETVLYIPNEDFPVAFHNRAFGQLQISEKSFDKSLPFEERQVILCKYFLASIRYLEAWKERNANLSDDEFLFIQERNPDFVRETETALEMQQAELDSILEAHGTLLSAAFSEKDKYDRCLLDSIAQIYLHSDSPLHSNIQTFLAQELESKVSINFYDDVRARMLYECAAAHSVGAAVFALSRFHFAGRGGLKKDAALGGDFLIRAADLGVVDAQGPALALMEKKERDATHPSLVKKNGIQKLAHKMTKLIRPSNTK